MNSNREYKTGAVTLMIDCGYDSHAFTTSKRTYQRILKGSELTLKGRDVFSGALDDLLNIEE